jgi:hypothetical protein
VKRLAPALAAVLLLAGCGNGPSTSTVVGSPSADSFRLSGTITVKADELASERTDGGDCYTSDGYDDIREGAQLTVKDETGTVIAIGLLDPGHVGEMNVAHTTALKCIFGFSADNVPEGKAFYIVEISHRGEMKYSRAQLSDSIALTLG